MLTITMWLVLYCILSVPYSCRSRSIRCRCSVHSSHILYMFTGSCQWRLSNNHSQMQPRVRFSSKGKTFSVCHVVAFSDALAYMMFVTLSRHFPITDYRTVVHGNEKSNDGPRSCFDAFYFHCQCCFLLNLGTNCWWSDRIHHFTHRFRALTASVLTISSLISIPEAIY